MFLKSVTFVFLVSLSSAFAQLAPAFFGAAFPSGFVGPFADFGASTSSSSFQGMAGDGRASTGPILFPPAPESRDTSGVVIGASGYGFVPPGGKGVVQQGRNLPPALPPPAFPSSYSEASPFSESFFHL